MLPNFGELNLNMRTSSVSYEHKSGSLFRAVIQISCLGMFIGAEGRAVGAEGRAVGAGGRVVGAGGQSSIFVNLNTPTCPLQFLEILTHPNNTDYVHMCPQRQAHIPIYGP